jgi:hypothetical protein
MENGTAAEGAEDLKLALACGRSLAIEKLDVVIQGKDSDWG